MNIRNVLARLEADRADLLLLQALILLAGLGVLFGQLTAFNGIEWSSERAEESGWLNGFAFAESAEGTVVDVDPSNIDGVVRNKDGAVVPDTNLLAAQAAVTVSDGARALQIGGSALGGFGIAGVLLAGFVIVGRAAKGRIFERSNARLFLIASALMLVAQVGEVVLSFSRAEALYNLGLTPLTSISFGYLVLALVLAALGHTWRVGCDLADETALTI